MTKLQGNSGGKREGDRLGSENDVLHVRMLDENFYIYLNDNLEIDEIFTSPILRNRSTKMLQLLAYLLYYHGVKVERSKLLAMLYGEDYHDTAHNNLRALVFRLRKILQKIGLPDKEYVMNQRGLYFWNEDAIQLDIDVEKFKKQAKHALGIKEEEERLAALKQVVSIIKQDFLKLFENEPWVVRESREYQRILNQCFEEVCRLQNKMGKYEETIKNCLDMLEIFIDERWFTYQIEAYLNLKQMDKAYQTYERAVKVLADEMGIEPSERFRSIFKGVNRTVEKSLESIKEIRKMLSDDREHGKAYYCSFPSFIDAYRLYGRLANRSKRPAFLILCTITDLEGERITNEKKLEKVSEQLKEAIMGAVRESDLLTRYNQSQYLLLLNGIVRENCSIVTSRINQNFKKINKSPNYFINFYVSSVQDVPPISIITQG